MLKLLRLLEENMDARRGAAKPHVLMLVFVLCGGLAVSGSVEAKKKTRKARASKQTKKAVKALMGRFKWGMTSQQVMKLLAEDLRRKYRKLLSQEQDAMVQDRLRKKLKEALAKLKKSYTKFSGKPIPWDASLVDQEFVHRNNESMLVRWEEKDRRFYFFFNNRLYKIFIAFNSELYAGKTFEDFTVVMEDRFGRARKQYEKTPTGKKVAKRLRWPQTRSTVLMAIDNTGFYGNFCLVLEATRLSKTVAQARKINNPKKKYRDAWVEAVTHADVDSRDANEDIVDQITGRGIRTPRYNDTASSPPTTTRRAKKSLRSSAATKSRRRHPRPSDNSPLDDIDL